MKYDLIYDPETRVHFLNGEQVPSVTEVMPERQFFVSDDRLEECRVEGEDNHDLLKMYWLTGEILNSPLLVAWDVWYVQNQKMLGELIQFEKPIASVEHRFCGKPDMMFSKAMIDFKRNPGDSSYHELQFQGYEIMACESGLIKPSEVHLVAWFDGTDIKTRNVYGRNKSGISPRDAFLACVHGWHNDKIVSTYMKNGRL